MSSALDIDALSVGRGAFSLHNITLKIPAGDYAILLGKNGAGKTTLMEAVCGLLPPRSGVISIAGVDVTRLTPAERNIGYVPQEGALFPTMSVQRNIEFALRLRKWDEARIHRRTQELSELLALGPLLHRKPATLSGGEARRVAIARALAFHPALLCLDEPLNGLDMDSRDSLLRHLEFLKRAPGITVLHITHNNSEGALLGTHVFELLRGTLNIGSQRQI